MEPAFESGEMVLVLGVPKFLMNYKIGDVVVLKKGKYMVKRIIDVKNKLFFVIGDNKDQSTDSRSFGWIESKNIVGKVIMKI